MKMDSSNSNLLAQESYITVAQEAYFEQEIKKSRFIAHAKNVKTTQAAEAFIAQEWQHNPEATHVVYAWITEKQSGVYKSRMSDNGEPQGTAGAPVFDVLDKNEIFDVVITVTRYFGGTLLGTGGLVKAYGSSASEVIKRAGLVRMVPGQKITVSMPYKFNDKFSYFLDELSVQVNLLTTVYLADVEFNCIVDLDYENEFIKSGQELTQGQAIFQEGEFTYQAKKLDYKKELNEDNAE